MDIPDGGSGRVEDGRGSLGHSATLRFPSPLIEPACPIKASGSPIGFTERHTGSEPTVRGSLHVSNSPSSRDTATSDSSGLRRCCQAHRQSPRPPHLRKHAKSQGPLLRRHYPTLLPPCPTPAMTVACRDVEAATLAPDGPPPITRTTFPTCRAHYPGGSNGCSCRLLPRSRGLPNGRRVGIRIVTFEACSGFTRITARRIAQPP
jgi:hypothetical protein